MQIESLQLSDFRNYEILSLSFSDGVNVLFGDNGQGKTNILEAVFLSATTKSHRGSKDREMIRLGKEEAHIRVMLRKKGISHRVDMHLKKNKAKGVAIDGIPIRRSAELFGLLHTVSFSPEDLFLIKNGPGERRRFLDLELCQLDRVYYGNLANYNKALIQRNQLLKQCAFRPELTDTLGVWNEQLVLYGSKIIEERKKFLEELKDIVKEKQQSITGGKETLEICYEPNTSPEEFAKKLETSLEREMFVKATVCGPHRDDVSFFVNGKNVKLFGSQGQQRTVALALKLAELEFVRKKTGDLPVLLLDDVLSELDRSRQIQLLQEIRKMQTIVTCTGLEELIECNLSCDRVYRVKEGNCESYEKEL